MREPAVPSLAACLATLLLAACMTFQPISPHLGIRESELEVHFATPRDLVGRTADGSTIVRRGLRRVVGRPLVLRGDSLVLEVARSYGAESWGRESRRFVAVIPTTDTSIDVGTRRRSHGRTLALVLSVPVTTWILFGIFYNPN